MITYKNKDYYSLNDLTVLFEENDERIKELKSLFLKTYSKVSDFYVRTSYLQSKIYPGLRKKELTYIKYKKDTDGKREYYLFNIDDLIKFFQKPIARNINQSSIKEIELVEIQD